MVFKSKSNARSKTLFYFDVALCANFARIMRIKAFFLECFAHCLNELYIKLPGATPLSKIEMLKVVHILKVREYPFNSASTSWQFVNRTAHILKAGVFALLDAELREETQRGLEVSVKWLG